MQGRKDHLRSKRAQPVRGVVIEFHFFRYVPRPFEGVADFPGGVAGDFGFGGGPAHEYGNGGHLCYRASWLSIWQFRQVVGRFDRENPAEEGVFGLDGADDVLRISESMAFAGELEVSHRDAFAA